MNEFELIDYLKDSLNDSKTIDTIEKLTQCLSFFKQINETIDINILNWATSIQRLINSFTLLTAPTVPKITNEEIIFKSPIIFVSEINEAINENKMINLNLTKSISIMSYLFVIDENLIFSGINLNIASYFWKILGNFKISLKGIDGKNNGYQGGCGGNFFGYTPQCFINEQKYKLTIDVSGGKGGNYGNKKIINFEEEEKSNKKILKKDENTYSYYERNQNILKSFKSKLNNQEHLSGLKMKRKEILNSIALNKKKSEEIYLLDKNLSEQNNKLIDDCLAKEQELRIQLSDINYSELFLCIKNKTQIFSSLSIIKKLLEAYENKDSYNSKINKLERDLHETLSSDLNEDFEKKQNKITIELSEVIRNLKLFTENQCSMDLNELKIMLEVLEDSHKIEEYKYESEKFEVINYDLIQNTFPDLKEIYRQKYITANELNSIMNELEVNIKKIKKIISQSEELGQSFKKFVQAHTEYDKKKKELEKFRNSTFLDFQMTKSNLNNSQVNLLEEFKILLENAFKSQEDLDNLLAKNDIAIPYSRDISNKPTFELNAKRSLLGVTQKIKYFKTLDQSFTEKKEQLKKVRENIKKVLKTVKPNLTQNIKKCLSYDNSKMIMHARILMNMFLLRKKLI